MIDRPVFDGERQRDALAALQKGAGLEATEAAGLVGLSYPQYNRYLWGKVPLRTDQLATFARAYRVTRADLVRALGLMDDDVDTVLRARIVDAAGPNGLADPDAAARVLAQHDADVQDDVVAQMLEVFPKRDH